MSTNDLTPNQLQNVEQVALLDQNDPAAIWAALAAMGDQYAASIRFVIARSAKRDAAIQGLET